MSKNEYQKLSDGIVDLIEAIKESSKDMHMVSSRPCETCRNMTKVLGFPYGCYEYQALREKKVQKL